MSEAKPVHAESSDPVQILNVQVQPNMIQVNDTFSLDMTILNNSTFPIYLTSGSCSPAFSVMFDAHTKQVYPNIACTTEAILQKVDPRSQVTISNANKPGIIYQAVQSGTATVNITLPYFTKNQTATDYSNINYNASKSFSFTILNQSGTSQQHTYGGGGPTVTITLDPLEQFKSGIAVKDVTCKEGLQLVIKTEDGSPACVKPDTVSILYLRGWSIGPVHGDIIFVIKPNTSGKIYVKYANQLSDIDAQLNTRLYDGSTGHEIQTTNLKVSVLPPVVLHNENLTATYYLTAQNNTAIYWLQVASCDFVPISVQSDSSQIHLSDLQNVMMSWKCPRPFVQYHITGTDSVDAVYVNDTG